jgi:long-chain acyl-CoA synthetase
VSKLGFWATASAEPSRVAIIDDDGTQYAAGDVLRRVNQQARALRSLGVQEGDAIAACLGVRVEIIELYLAALQSGCYFVPLPHGSAPSEIAHMLADSGAKVCVFDSEAAASVSAAAALLPRQVSCFAVGEVAGAAPWRAVWAECSADAPERPVAGQTLIYTSGTTGVPRAVRRPLRGLTLEQIGKLAAVHLNAVARIRPRSGACHLVSSPLYHSASLLWCGDHLHLGHAVSLLRKWSPEAMLQRVERDRVTGTLLAPIHFHRLLALPPELREQHDLSSLRHVVHTGAPCPVDVKKRMLDWWGPVIYEVYGATEGGGTAVGPEEWLERPGTVGRGFGRIRVLRDDGSRCQPGEPGKVFIQLSQQRFEYQLDREKTESTRSGNYFTVGDVGYLDEDDYLFLCGRSSDVIISGGVNIYPAQIESVLAAHPAVGDVAVFGVPDPEWGEQVKALVALANGWSASQALVDELKLYCRSRLAALKCPRTIEFVAALPRGEHGKLFKGRLREVAHSQPAV